MALAAAILAAVAYGLSAALAQIGLQYTKPLLGTIISVFASFTSVFITLLIVQPKALLTVSLVIILWFAIIGVINFTVGRYMRYTAATYIGVSRSASLASATPLFTMFFALVFLRETITWPVFLGTVLVATGLYLLARE